LVAACSSPGARSEDAPIVGAPVDPRPGTYVAPAADGAARELGIAWYEARFDPAANGTDAVGVLADDAPTRVAMSYVAHGASGAPVAEGVIQVDVRALFETPLDADFARLSRAFSGSYLTASDGATIDLTTEKRNTIVRSMLHNLASSAAPPPSGVAIKDENKPDTSPCGEGLKNVTQPRVFLSPCFDSGQGLFKNLALAFDDAILHALTHGACLELETVAVASVILLFAGPIGDVTDVAIDAEAGELAKDCALDTIKEIALEMLKDETLNVLLNLFCSQRAFDIPSFPVKDEDARTVLELVLGATGAISSGDVEGAFNGAQKLEQLWAGLSDCKCDKASHGKYPFRIVNDKGQVACEECPPGTTADDSFEGCKPNDPDSVITQCVKSGAPDVFLVNHDLCEDVMVARYSPQDLGHGDVQEQMVRAVPVPKPSDGKPYRFAMQTATSYDECWDTTVPGSEDREKFDQHRPGPVTSGVFVFETADDPVMYVASAEDDKPLPGHACAKDAVGHVTCLDARAALYRRQGASPVRSLYFCAYANKTASCKDAGVLPLAPREAGSHSIRSYRTNTCPGAPTPPMPACETIAADGPAVMQTSGIGAGPSPMGGAPVDGTYVKTADVLYGSFAGAGGPTGTSSSATMKVDGSASGWPTVVWARADDDGNGHVTRESETFQLHPEGGANATYAYACPAYGTRTQGYTWRATDGKTYYDHFYAGRVETYEKQ
jgi:hypothetical protein